MLVGTNGNAILNTVGSWRAEMFGAILALLMDRTMKMVDITPEANIFGIFKNLNYKTWYALGEFVDNSIASWEKWSEAETGMPRPERVKVQIRIENGGANPFIEITDNSSGIQYSNFATAFKVASIPEDGSSLNEFGMGMKTAGFWFANSWSVRTSFAGEAVERTMNFDLTEILRDQTKEIQPIEVTAPLNAHYTTVRLTKLNQMPKGRNKAKVKEHLTGMYRQFLRDGVLELHLDGEKLEYEEVEILNFPKVGGESTEVLEWKKEVDFLLPEGGHVKGFVAIRKKANTTHAGLSLMRKRRLIEGSADETFRPQEIFGNSNSYEYQRIFGELHLSGFKVTHTKDAIKWDEGQKESFLDILLKDIKSEPMNLIAQAQKYRVRGTPPPRATLLDAIAAVSETLGVTLVDAIDRIDVEESDITASIPDELEMPDVEYVEKEITLNSASYGSWVVKITGFNDPAVTDFFRLSSAEADNGLENRIAVQMNLSHPFATQYLGPNLANLELLLSLTACLCVALSLGKRNGAKSGYIIDYLNEILRIGELN